jgi:hypothetical protein
MVLTRLCLPFRECPDTAIWVGSTPDQQVNRKSRHLDATYLHTGNTIRNRGGSDQCSVIAAPPNDAEEAERIQIARQWGLPNGIRGTFTRVAPAAHRTHARAAMRANEAFGYAFWKSGATSLASLAG